MFVVFVDRERGSPSLQLDIRRGIDAVVSQLAVAVECFFEEQKSEVVGVS